MVSCAYLFLAIWSLKFVVVVVIVSLPTLCWVNNTYLYTCRQYTYRQNTVYSFASILPIQIWYSLILVSLVFFSLAIFHRYSHIDWCRCGNEMVRKYSILTVDFMKTCAHHSYTRTHTFTRNFIPMHFSQRFSVVVVILFSTFFFFYVSVCCSIFGFVRCVRKMYVCYTVLV